MYEKSSTTHDWNYEKTYKLPEKNYCGTIRRVLFYQRFQKKCVWNDVTLK